MNNYLYYYCIEFDYRCLGFVLLFCNISELNYNYQCCDLTKQRSSIVFLTDIISGFKR